jgi:hypothetical protein
MSTFTTRRAPATAASYSKCWLFDAVRAVAAAKRTDYATLHPMETSIDRLSVLRWYGIDFPRDPACPHCSASQLASVKSSQTSDVEFWADQQNPEN